VQGKKSVGILLHLPFIEMDKSWT